ncbi:TolC family protein [Massilia yuzhufengensis]|uniref:Outer membrane protein TolC n=1 Tax=Massilia yuzhufengensis TaxID=1164594 RepID=A0A1I1VFY9_9BURK|nr:TolC family protein [Massilia yuzhufengensis]SFD81789.1 Outer membrane protein TolC [Massilia yuzhufengensis]
MRTKPVLPGIVAAALLALAQAAHADAGVDYAEAWRRVRATAGSVNGARLDFQAKQLQAEALRRIDGPDVRLSGFAGRVSTTLSVDTGAIAQLANPVLDSLPPLPGLNLPDVPQALNVDRVFDVRSLGLSTVWPLYTGGRLDAVKQIAAGRADEAGASVQAALDDASTQLAQRYFTVQLARKAWQLRSAAVEVAKEHQRMALKMERTGLIAKVERLKADVAVDNALREAAKAGSDLEIAQLALRRLLDAPDAVLPATPLFVHAQPPGSLASFIDAAMASNAAWKQIASKRKQADGAVQLQGRAFSPTVIGIANYNLNRGSSSRANWLVGVSVSVPLVERIDRARMISAARLEQQRVVVAAEQAGRDLPTLAESQWRTMEDARLRYLSMGSAIELAYETRRLAQVGFQNGQATSTDVADASLNYTKASLERSQAAYEYVMALARLLGTAGDPGRLYALSRSATHIVDLTKE